MWKVPVFDIDFDEMEENSVQSVLRSGWLTMSGVTREFEEAFAGFIGVRHAIAVSSGTAALHLAHLALGAGPGDDVICPSLTFVAGANSVVYTGARPVFADITGLNDFNLSPDSIESSITEKTKVIQVVHYAGFPCDMNRIAAIAREHGISIVEDCAHALGSEYKGMKCGSIGEIGCFSFFSNKNMTTAEGGMITTNNDELAQKIKRMRSHGMTTLTEDRHSGSSFSYDVTELGFNYRIDEIRSALGLTQLEKLNDCNEKRRELVRIYKARLSGIEGLSLPFEGTSGTSSHHIFPVLLMKEDQRYGFLEYMKGHGIQTSIHYPCVHLFQYYRSAYGFVNGLLPVSENVASREVTLPLYPSMTKGAVDIVCDIVEEYFKNGAMA